MGSSNYGFVLQKIVDRTFMETYGNSVMTTIKQKLIS